MTDLTLGAGNPKILPAGKPLTPKLDRDGWVLRIGLGLIGFYLTYTVLIPLVTILAKSFQNRAGEFIGFANFAKYFSNEALHSYMDGAMTLDGTAAGLVVAITCLYAYHLNKDRASPQALGQAIFLAVLALFLVPVINIIYLSLTPAIWNSLFISTLSALITVTLAFLYAYSINRTCMPLKSVFKGAAMLPILAPSLLPAISLVYLFGNQGLLKGWMGDASIYGPIGIVIGEVFWTFPHAFIILTTALSLSDARMYEAASALGASKLRTFWTVTLPGAKYGLISAAIVTFTLVITDFGVPKVIGGQYNVLATDVYKQVVGLQDFQMGAVVGIVLLIPAVAAFFIDRMVQKRQTASLSARAVPYKPKPQWWLDYPSLLFCSVVILLVLGVLGMAGYASLIKFWPYNMELSLNNYNFDLMDGGGWNAFWNSIKMALWTAVFGTILVFIGAYLVEKSKGFAIGRSAIHFLALLPMAIPGMVLGLSYIFFFNMPENPFGFLYGTMAILVICTISHFYTVSHLTAVTALKQLDAEYESVSASLKVPVYKTFWRVTVPICLPAVLDISIYYFVNAMTTVSAVVFIYSSDTELASVAVLNMDDAGDIAPAAAMAMMIVLTAGTVRVLHAIGAKMLSSMTQKWRR